MRIELHSSNRNEWPRGTGRSPMHGRALTDMRCRTTHGPRGTAQGNRGSAAQGGVRALLGLLPFKTSATAVGACGHAGVAFQFGTGMCLVPGSFTRTSVPGIHHVPTAIHAGLRDRRRGIGRPCAAGAGRANHGAAATPRTLKLSPAGRRVEAHRPVSNGAMWHRS